MNSDLSSQIQRESERSQQKDKSKSKNTLQKKSDKDKGIVQYHKRENLSNDEQAPLFELGSFIFRRGMTKQQILQTMPKKLYKKKARREWNICPTKLRKDQKLQAKQLQKVCLIAQSIPFEKLSINGARQYKQAYQLFSSLLNLEFPRLKLLQLGKLSLESLGSIRYDGSIIEKIQTIYMPRITQFFIDHNDVTILRSFRKVHLPTLEHLRIGETLAVQVDPLCELQCLNLRRLMWKRKTNKLILSKKKKASFFPLFKLYPQLKSYRALEVYEIY